MSTSEPSAHPDDPAATEASGDTSAEAGGPTPFGHGVDLDAHTLEALDWPAVQAAAARHARTPRGRALAQRLGPLGDAEAIEAALDLVDELIDLEDAGAVVPVGGLDPIEDEVTRAAKGSILDTDELNRIGRSLTALHRLAGWVAVLEDDVPRLRHHAERIQLDTLVVGELEDAFDPTGALSELAYPVLGELRQRIQSLHTRVRETLDELIKGDTLGDALQDRFVTQRDDRYVLPIKTNFRRKDMGIVHGTSGSGQTAFVEPHQVVALNNDLRLAEGELAAAERRILTHLSTLVGRIAPQIREALDAATDIDLGCVRAGLSRDLDGVRPTVGDGGVLHLPEARHPVLVLRGLDVVPNDLHLGPDAAIVVISGPNTGGKTIALKTFGLCALLLRSGCRVPAAEGARVDRFDPILALIGDQQAVLEDHSSFSGHLVALGEMVQRARPGGLYLVDEIASGTDPQQGAALAHAFLEHLLATSPRAVITTHFHRLKTVHATDPRFTVAGMQFAEGRPTYRLVAGATGDSHALSVAERVGMPPALVERARQLMGERERDLAETLEALDREKARAEEASRQAKALARELEQSKARVARREERIETAARTLERKEAEAFLQRMRKADKAIAAVVADLQRDPSHKRVAAAKATLSALQGLADEVAPAPAATPPPAEPDALEPGQPVKLHALGQKGTIEEVRGDTITVKVGAMTVRVGPDELTPLDPRTARPKRPRRPKASKKKKKKKRSSGPSEVRTVDLDQAMRHDANTVDLRGQRVDEGLDTTEQFLDHASMRGMDVVFILHGHGTGAMKSAIRRWLPSCPYVTEWQPARSDQGGDAYTVARLR